MEQNIVIYIGIYKTGGIIATIILGAWYASHRLTKVETKVDGFDTRLTTLEGRVDRLFEGQSPIALLSKGAKILEESGLKQWIENNKADLTKQCEAKQSMENPYDIQTAAFA